MRINYSILLIIFTYCSGRQRIMKYVKLPSDATLDGLGCAIEWHNTSRGVKFDPETGTCTSLTDTWFNSPTFESSTNYFKISSLDNVLQQGEDTVGKGEIVYFYDYQYSFYYIVFKSQSQGKHTSIWKSQNTFDILPSNFVVGCSIVLYMQIGSGGYYGDTHIAINNLADTIVGMYVNIRDGLVVLNALDLTTGIWGAEIRFGYNPFVTANQIYKLEFKLTSTEFKFYVDDVVLYDFTHRYPIDQYERITFGSDSAYCNRILVLYPD